MATPRWEGDEIGSGVGDAGEFAREIRELLDVMTRPDWVTEDPQVHVRPRLFEAAESGGAPWRVVEESVVLAVYVVRLEWQRREGTLADLRRDVFSLVGAVAGPTTHVHERLHGRVEYRVTTGALDGATPYRSHGHTLRLEIEGTAARRLVL
jgi:hypothetical protein